jgi:hypothetical protein
MESAMEKINFLRRGLISILVGSFVLVVGVALYFILNAGTTFLYVILGFSIPFFFIGSILTKWHFANRKRKRQEPSSQIT